MRLAWGQVAEVAEEREGFQRLVVTLDDGSAGVGVCYPALVGQCSAGERVLLNTTAVDLALGTGGLHFVVARAGLPGTSPKGVQFEAPSGGHVMKVRYTPLQRDVVCAEAQEGERHADLEFADDVGGMPVVCCGLHSQVPLVAAALKAESPDARIAYVMTDGAALPMALSELVPSCVGSGLIDTTLTCGQAFGGAIEAVTLHSGLLVARIVARADVAIVAIGPGMVGTGTVFGHGGVAQGEAVNAASVVGGRPIAVLRLSFADSRLRHHGVSHHSVSALGRVALARAIVAVPSLPPEQAAVLEGALADAHVWDRHARVDVEARPLPDMRGVRVRTMGRGPSDDPAFFAAAAAAGTVASRLLSG
jgi:hypothetical protein